VKAVAAFRPILDDINTESAVRL